MDVSKTVNLGNHSDSDNISPWAEDAMSWAFAKSIITEGTANMIMPKADVSAQEAEGIVKKFIEL